MGSLPNSVHVRVNLAAKATLSELAQKQGRSLQSVLEDAIDCYQREVFFKEMESAYKRLQADPEAWNQELAERAAWDATILDDLAE